MSQENVEIFRRAFEAYERGDLDAAVANRRGKGSGVEMESDTAVVYELRDGRVVRIQAYMDRAMGLEAAGLRE